MRICLDFRPAAAEGYDAYAQAALKKLHDDKKTPVTLTAQGQFLALAVAGLEQPAWFTVDTDSSGRDLSEVQRVWTTRLGSALTFIPEVETSKRAAGDLVYFLRVAVTGEDAQMGLFRSVTRVLEFADHLRPADIQYIHALAERVTAADSTEVPF